MKITIIEEVQDDTDVRLVLHIEGETTGVNALGLATDITTHLEDLLVRHGYSVTRTIDGEEVALA